MSYATFATAISRINDVLCTLNLLNWDSRTVMPAGGVGARAHQIATLTDIARGMATDPALAELMDRVQPDSPLQARAIARARAEIDVLRKIPARIISEMASLKTHANAAWVAARADNDFAGYAPVLKRMIGLQREIAGAIGTGGHPYDAMVQLYEPGMTYARLTDLYARLKTALIPLIRAAADGPQPRADILTRPYPVAAQREFGLRMAQKMGYDLHYGRLDDTVHPFEISFTRDDVRITSRFRETWLPGGLFALWHEAGHGMYEQGVNPAYSRTVFATDLSNLYAVGGASFGMHESQSRLWENRVGRSRAFWGLHYGALRDSFPDQLADVTEDDFWRAVNAVRPSTIRVEADELTYDMHIILRSEIEAGLMTGDIGVDDLPGLWAEKMRDYLGITVPDDRQGVLQDVHWSHGYVGSFPTYTIGNIMSSQLYAVASRDPAIAAGLEVGEYAPLHRWLGDNVWVHGRASTPTETLQRVTGGPLDPAPYVADLTAKVAVLLA